MKKFTIYNRPVGPQFTIKLTFLLFTFYIVHSTFYIPIFAAPSLDQSNQKVCDRFEEDITKMAAIMDELKDRKGITETRVAFGGVDTKVESADYWITSAAEAVAFQRVQSYSSAAQLKSSLIVLKNKVLRAKSEVKEALNEQ